MSSAWLRHSAPFRTTARAELTNYRHQSIETQMSFANVTILVFVHSQCRRNLFPPSSMAQNRRSSTSVNDANSTSRLNQFFIHASRMCLKIPSFPGHVCYTILSAKIIPLCFFSVEHFLDLRRRDNANGFFQWCTTLLPSA